MTDDATLLRRYATERSEAAIAEFVRRHLSLVYSAAVRRLGGDTHRAEDVAQTVFCAVVRDAEKLAQHAMLTGWLYTATRNAVIDAQRSESRRAAREEAAHTLHVTLAEPADAADWSRLRPVLDLAMDELGADDREAVLLRFFENRSFAEVGAALNASEEAARKRVDRALDKLRGLLGRHQIVSTSAALGTVLAAETALAAPAGLAASITGAALAAGGAAATGGATVFALTKLQVGLALGLAAAGVAGLVTQQRTLSTLRETSATTEQRVAQLAAENAALTQASAANAAELAHLREQNVALGQAVSDANARAAVAVNTARAASRPSSTSAPVLASAPGVVATPPLSDAKKASWHRRYDPFFQQRTFTPAQVERIMELWYQQEIARGDLQSAVTAAGLRGDARGVEALRTKLYAPITQELRAIMGADGLAAYYQYEGDSYYRVIVSDFLTPSMARAGLSLSPEQIDRLATLVRANSRGVRENATDIGSVTRIDWNAVADQAGNVLAPGQLAVLRDYASRTTSGK